MPTVELQYRRLTWKEMAFVNREVPIEKHWLMQGQELSEHSHEYDALCVVISGQADCKGETIGDGANYNAIIVPRGEVHKWRALRSATCIGCFDKDILDT